MKHGIVRNGRSTTYYGNDATRFLARKSAEYAFTQEDATKKVRNASSVEFRNMLVEELKKFGYTFTEAYIAKLNKKTAAEAEKREAMRLAEEKGFIRELPKTTKPTRSKCRLCGKSIRKGVEYYDGDSGNRTHASCAE